MQPAKKTYLALCLIALIAVACGPVTQVAIPTATNSLATAILPSATFTPVPTLPPTPRQAIVVSPTSFLPSSWEYSPPSFGPSAYRLKPWTEADFAFFINSMNTGELFDFYPTHLPVFDSFYGYEYLLHSDQVDSNNDIVWTIAQMSPRGIPLPGMGRDEEYFNFLIERLLNNANVPLAKLRGTLKRHGFGVTNTYIAKDFYGEGEDAFFFDVV